VFAYLSITGNKTPDRFRFVLFGTNIYIHYFPKAVLYNKISNISSISIRGATLKYVFTRKLHMHTHHIKERKLINLQNGTVVVVLNLYGGMCKGDVCNCCL